MQNTSPAIDLYPASSEPWKPLSWASFPAKLYVKGRKVAWDAGAIDFSQDAEDWLKLNDADRRVILQMVAIFAEGEGAVTAHLTPLLYRLSQQGQREEEIYLIQFMLDEAQHVEGFDRFLSAVAPGTDLRMLQTPTSRYLFHEELPKAMAKLLHDDSPKSLAEASATYNMIMEGVIAETGYYTWRNMLSKRGLMPGMQKLILHVSTDEARHIAFGLHLLGRLIREDQALLPVVQNRMNELLQPVLRMLKELFASFPEGNTFALKPLRSVKFALRQFGYRLHALRRAAALEDMRAALARECDVEDENQTSGTGPVMGGWGRVLTRSGSVRKVLHANS